MLTRTTLARCLSHLLAHSPTTDGSRYVAPAEPIQPLTAVAAAPPRPLAPLAPLGGGAPPPPPSGAMAPEATSKPTPTHVLCLRNLLSAEILADATELAEVRPYP